MNAKLSDKIVYTLIAQHYCSYIELKQLYIDELLQLYEIAMASMHNRQILQMETSKHGA